jgi:hypothetical protein
LESETEVLAGTSVAPLLPFVLVLADPGGLVETPGGSKSTAQFLVGIIGTRLYLQAAVVSVEPSLHTGRAPNNGGPWRQQSCQHSGADRISGRKACTRRQASCEHPSDVAVAPSSPSALSEKVHNLLRCAAVQECSGSRCMGHAVKSLLQVELRSGLRWSSKPRNRGIDDGTASTPTKLWQLDLRKGW